MLFYRHFEKKNVQIIIFVLNYTCLFATTVLKLFFLDYAVNIFHDALKTGNFTSFLRANTRLPMMYIEDCLRSVVQFMEIPNKELKQRTYNVTAMSFTPEELVEEVKKYVPHLNAKYEPDSRQMIGTLGLKKTNICRQSN